MSAPTPVAPWHAALPAPRSKPPTISAEELFSMMQEQKKEESTVASFLIVDVRRTDFDVAFITGAINLPAQSFHQTLPSLLPILTKYQKVIFHCQSSQGRGPRVAAWYQDALNDAGVPAGVSESWVLHGGIKKWVELYRDSPLCTPLAQLAE